jgi:hypothetical protein
MPTTIERGKACNAYDMRGAGCGLLAGALSSGWMKAIPVSVW